MALDQLKATPLEEAWAVPGVAAQYPWKLLSDEVYTALRANPRFQKLLAKPVGAN